MADDAGVPLKDYVDALNAERRQTGNMRALAIIGTGGALIFGIMRAVSVYAASTDKLFSLHNDLIRSGERQRAEVERKMATKEEIEPLKAFVDGEQSSSKTSGKFWGAIIAAGTFALMLGFGLANLVGTS